jgi:peptidoglycan/LPS O-acetylase OafA/YrhL
MSASQRFAILDVGRALAITGVIAIHLALFLPNLPVTLQHVTEYGQYGVQLFFVISAITICKTLEDAGQQTASTREAVRMFYIKRFFRIAPLYYIGVAVYGILDLLGTRFAHAQVLAPHHLTDVVANLLFIHAWVPSAVNSVVPGGWSIGIEMFFYALAPLLFFAAKTRSGLWVITVGTALLCSVFLYAGACLGHAGCTVPNNTFLYYWPPTQLPCFIVGFWLWHLYKPLLSGAQRASRLTTVAAAAALAGFGALLVAAIGMEAFAAVPVLVAFASAALLVALCGVPARMLLAPVVLRIGQNSYGIYIWHFLAIFAVRMALKTPLSDVARHYPVATFALGAVVVLLLAHAAALVTAREIEQPVSRWARRRLIGRRQAARPLPASLPVSPPPAAASHRAQSATEY